MSDRVDLNSQTQFCNNSDLLAIVVMPRFRSVRFRGPFCRTVTRTAVRVSWEAD